MISLESVPQPFSNPNHLYFQPLLVSLAQCLAENVLTHDPERFSHCQAAERLHRLTRWLLEQGRQGSP